MKINILLPYKEEFLNEYAGAVSILVKDQLKYSKFKRQIKVYGVVDKKIIHKNFIGIPRSKFFRNYLYVKNFINKVGKEKSIIELHNRPFYLSNIKKKIPNNKFILYFHNNPQELKGSKSLIERLTLLKECDYIIFLSNWIKEKFFLGIDQSKYNHHKVIYPGANKLKNKTKKQNIIFFSGKHNEAKGYNLFCEATKEFLKKNKNWEVISAGSEPRRNIRKYNHVKELGQIPHEKVIEYLNKSKISIAPSIWEEPLGRLPIESAALKTVCISSNNGGLKESNKYGLLIKKINTKKIIKKLLFLNNVNNFNKIQKQIAKNFNLYIQNQVNDYDSVRNLFIQNNDKNNKKNLKILHISNFNDNADGRLYYSTQKKINFGFTKLNHNIYTLDEKLFFRNSNIFFKKKHFNHKVINIVKNFFPDLIILGHVETISDKTFYIIKKINPELKIIRIYIDSIDKKFYKQNSKIIFSNYNFIDQIFITSLPRNIIKKYQKKFCFMPNIVDKSIDVLRNFENKQFQYDLFFALSHGQNRGIFKKGFIDERDVLLKNIYHKTPFLKKYFISTYFNSPLWGDNYFKILSKCRMALNISRGINQNFYSSDRISSLFGNGLLVFIDKKTNLQKIIKKNEAIFFSSEKDLIKKLAYFQKNQKICKIIAKNGYQKFHKVFSSTEVCAFILKKIGLTILKKKFLWEKFTN